MIMFNFYIPIYIIKWIDNRFMFFKYLEDYFGEYDGYTYTNEIESDTYIDDGCFFIGKYNNKDNSDDEFNNCYCVPLFIGKIISWFNKRSKEK